MTPPYSYLGRVILGNNNISHQQLRLRTYCLKTLNHFQKLLGDINWIHPFLKITTFHLKSLFDTLKGDASRELTEEAKLALVKVEKAINNQQLKRLNYTRPWDLVILETTYKPTGCLWQEGPLDWLHLPNSAKKVVTAYTSLVAEVIRRGRYRSKEIFGRDPHNIIVPYNSIQVNNLLMTSLDWQVATALSQDRYGSISPLVHCCSSCISKQLFSSVT